MRGEGQRGRSPVLLEMSLAPFDRAQNPSIMAFADFEPNNVVGGLIDENGDALHSTDDRPYQ